MVLNMPLLQLLQKLICSIIKRLIEEQRNLNNLGNDKVCISSRECLMMTQNVNRILRVDVNLKLLHRSPF